MKIATSREMREIDKSTMEWFGLPGVVLMENAGQAVAAYEGLAAALHRRLDACARLVDRVRVGPAEHHNVDVVRCGTGFSEHPRGEGAVDKRRLDPVDAAELLGQDHNRAGSDREDLAQRLHQRALAVGADQPRAAHPSLAQDAGVHQARDLPVHSRVGQDGPFGQIGDAQLVTGE